MDSAAHAYSMVSVPLYDTLGPDAVEYIANHAELAAVAVSAALLPTLLPCLPRCPSIKLVVRRRGRCPLAAAAAAAGTAWADLAPPACPLPSAPASCSSAGKGCVRRRPGAHAAPALRRARRWCGA